LPRLWGVGFCAARKKEVQKTPSGQKGGPLRGFRGERRLVVCSPSRLSKEKGTAKKRNRSKGKGKGG